MVTFTGSGFTLSTDVIGKWRNYHNAIVESRLLNPNFVDATGTQMTVQIPSDFNGAFALSVVGSSFTPTLYIVPVVDSLTLTGQGSSQLRGRGFVEGNGSQYTFPGIVVTDTDISGGPDVSSCCVHQNDIVNLPLPAHGAGNFTVTTSGGTSAPFAANFIHPAAGDLRDVSFGNGQLWVATLSGQLRQCPRPPAKRWPTGRSPAAAPAAPACKCFPPA